VQRTRQSPSSDGAFNCVGAPLTPALDNNVMMDEHERESPNGACTWSPGEQRALNALQSKLRALGDVLPAEGGKEPADLNTVFAAFELLRRALGNLDNDISFLACLRAKRHLAAIHGEFDCDVSVKHQNAAGVDIEARTAAGSKIVAEIKTMRPVGPGGDFGANQAKQVRQDLERLRRSEAEHKYFCVTDATAATALRRARYANDVAGVTVLLV